MPSSCGYRDLIPIVLSTFHPFFYVRFPQGAKCQWTSPPPDHFLDAMAALSLKAPAVPATLKLHADVECVPFILILFEAKTIYIVYT